MLTIPKRSEVLLQASVSCAHVVSIYHHKSSVFIELDTGRTLEIEYAPDCSWSADLIAAKFVRHMSLAPTLEEWEAMPTPVGGRIIRMA